MSNMRVINTGNKYQIHDSSMRTFDELPAQTYNVCFSKQSGWYLQKYTDDITVAEKVYGVHINKVNKVLSSFAAFERNLGVILSGDKGIGKSLFSKILANRALALGYPLIIVNSYIPGVADFIDSIDQECVILFDEFDKTFAASGGVDPQAEMLTLFDGISQGKKLFVVTCNSLYKLNDFLVNRPGRFHYHFRFEYPTDAEITEYMQDKLDEKYWKEINKVIAFSKKVSLNYDCLRAIAFELANGLTFETAISDLNIINTNGEQYFATLFFKDGTRMNSRSDVTIDMFDMGDTILYMYTADSGDNFLDVSFCPRDNYYDVNRHGMVIDGKNVTPTWYWDQEDIDSWDEKTRNHRSNYLSYYGKEVDYILFRRKVEKNIHYAV